MDILEIFQKIIKYIGTGNLLTIITFLICLLVSYYFYFKTFYRLVYSKQTICKTCETFDDWKNENKEFNTRLIVYNNGRKTISNNQLKNFKITSTKKIINVFIIKSIDNLNIKINNTSANIEIDYLDSSDFFVLEIVHNGNIELVGRIEETGKLLYREPINWVIVNAIIILPLIFFLFYNMYYYLGNDEPQFLSFFINFILTYVILLILKLLHRLFFIPDKLTAKYADSKDKWNTRFKN